MKKITTEEWCNAKKASRELSIFYGFTIGIVLFLIKPMSFMGLWQYLASAIVIVILTLIVFVFDIYTMTHDRSIFES